MRSRPRPITPPTGSRCAAKGGASCAPVTAGGTGVADRLLGAVQARAVALGATRVIRQCGTAQPEAIAVYRRHGDEPIAPFGEYAGFASSRGFGRDL